MKINTRVFGEVDIAEEKVLAFDNGIIGLEDMKKFVLLYDSEKGEGDTITWLQSLDDADFAIPVINPYIVKQDYNPMVEDEMMASLGDLNPEDLMVFTTIKVPADITQMTVNFKAPIIIHAKTRKGCQIIAENDDYLVRQPVYEELKNAKERAGE